MSKQDIPHEVIIVANQLALVTGPSSPIGLFLAKKLAARGYDLASPLSFTKSGESEMTVIDTRQSKEGTNRFRSGAVTLDGRYLPPPEDKDGKVWVRTSAIIQAEANRLYELWSDLDSVPLWQEQIVQVSRTGPGTSHWVMRKGDGTIEWDAEVLAEEPGHRLAWKSVQGDVDTAGEVIFEPAPTGRGTMVTVLQEFRQGKLASLWETFTGRNPKQAVIENLRHFKALAETGEIPRTQGQPHGPRGLIGTGKASAYGETIATPPGNHERQAS